jgi:hypothetical protein
MLHRINPAAEAELRSVVAFQRKVLTFARSPALTVPLNRGEVDAHFDTQADWFWRHKSLHDPVTKLNAAVRAAPALAIELLTTFDNDVAFDAHLDDPAYAFACCRLRADVKDLVGDVLVSFYDLLGSKGGFPTEITGGDVLTRDVFVQEFWRLNSELKVCPACDGPRPDRTKKIHAQCDHHFPKSIHAALSIHPKNLVPICLECNLTFKGERDANEKAGLSEMFLPYAREAFGPLAIKAFRDGHGELEVQMSDGGAANTKRIESLDHILQLRERWTSRLSDRVSVPIVNALRQQARTAERRGDSAADRLMNVTAQREGFRKARGKQHDSILSEAYCAMLEADAGELGTVFA